MAIAVTMVKRSRMGQQIVNTVDLVPDNSWLAAGEVVNPTQVGLTSVDFASFDQIGGYTWSYSRSASKVLAYRQTDPAAAGGADVPLAAVADAADLSALTVRVTFWGR